MHSSALKFRLNGPNASFGLPKSARRSYLAELAVGTIFEAREGEYCVQLLTVFFKFLVPSDKSRRSQKCADEVDHLVRTSGLPLTIQEDPVETPPFGGLARIID